jgi:hypothetical protein
LLIKRGNFYTHANYQKIESNIFPVFYLFHRTYTKISMIFESVSNFLHKIKHTSQFCIKEKGKGHCSYGRPARLWPKPAHALNPPSPLSLQDADGEVPLVSFVSTTHGGSAMAPAAVGEGLGPRARAQRLRLSLAILLLSPKRALLSPFHLGHANGGRPP